MRFLPRLSRLRPLRFASTAALRRRLSLHGRQSGAPSLAAGARGPPPPPPDPFVPQSWLACRQLLGSGRFQKRVVSPAKGPSHVTSKSAPRAPRGWARGLRAAAAFGVHRPGPNWRYPGQRQGVDHVQPSLEPKFVPQQDAPDVVFVGSASVCGEFPLCE